MGLSESKVIADSISKACNEATDAEEIDVDALLSKQEFMESLRKVWTYVPEKTRRSIGRCPKMKNPKRSQAESRKSTKQAMPKITISQDIMASVPDWDENPSSFFRDKSINLDLEISPIAGAYLCLEQIDRREKIDIIRARLIKTLFYRLKIRSSLRYMRSNNVNDVTSIICNSGLVPYNLDEVKRNIVRWTDQGGRIDALCQSIGGSSTDEDSYLGNIFCLPENYHDEFIRILGYKGSYRDKQIQNIKDCGILNVQGRAVLDKLAGKVFNFLWERVKASIDDFITQAPESVLGRNLQQTRCFQIEQQSQRAVLQSDISTPNGGHSHTSDEAQEIHPGHEALLHTTHDSAATSYLSPAIAARLQEASNHSFDNATNLMAGANPHHGQTYDEVMNVDDNLQPLLLMQGHGSIHGQAPIDTANILNTREILEPLLPAYNFSSFDGHSQSNAVEMAGLHDMFQSTPPVQTARTVASQQPIQDRFFVPRESRIMHAQSPGYGQFTPPVPAL